MPESASFRQRLWSSLFSDAVNCMTRRRAGRSDAQPLLLRTAAAIVALWGLTGSMAQAQTYTWDPGQTGTATVGGTGTWNTSTTNWFNGTADAAWPNTTGFVANFGGTAGTVSL